MTYLLTWFICAITAYLLTRNYVESNLRRVGVADASIAQAMRNAAKRDDSIEEIYNAPDNLISAVFWTLVLVINLLLWPMVLVTLVWWYINKQDFSEFGD